MRICASTVCHHSSRHLQKWKKQQCDKHGLANGSCGCSPPFRFHYFPADPAVKEEWVKRVNRAEAHGSGVVKKKWQPRKDSVLCSDHFVNGAPSKEYPVPWLKLGKDFGNPKSARRSLQRKLPPLKKQMDLACYVTIADDDESCEGQDETLPLVPEIPVLSNPVPVADIQLDSFISEHNYSYSCRCCEACTCPGCYEKDLKIKELLQHVNDLEDTIAKAEKTKLEIKSKTKDVRKKPFETTKFSTKLLTSDKKVQFYTGLPSKAVFDLVFQYLEPKLGKMSCWRGAKEVVNKVRRRRLYRSPGKFGRPRKLQLKDLLVMVLMKLRLGLLNEDLADRFQISTGYCSRIFTTMIKSLAHELRKAVTMPGQENIRANLPKVFQKHYKQLRGILDCTEIFIQRPRNLELQAMTYSDYKSHNTAKILVCITPRGRIGFVSKAWGGRASDKEIVKKSGFLDLVMPQDQYMVDKGFPIREELMLRGAHLVIPPPSKGQEQFTSRDTMLTKKVANLRIHVERAIGRLKWFRILQNTLPITLVPLIDDIIITCAGLCNFYDNLV